MGNGYDGTIEDNYPLGMYVYMEERKRREKRKERKKRNQKKKETVERERKLVTG